MEFLKNEELKQMEEFIEDYKAGRIEKYNDMVEEIDSKSDFEKIELLKELDISGAEDLEEFESDFEEFMQNNFSDSDPLEVANSIHFGKYNPSDDYIHLNGYGNVETISKYEFDGQLAELIDNNRVKIIRHMIENYDFYYFAKIHEFLKEAENFYTQKNEENKKELDEFITENVFWAFMDSQFQEGLQKLGLEDNENDLKKITMIPGGGYILKEKYKTFCDLIEQKEQKDVNQQNNILFLAGAVSYHLDNYEFTYTRDDSEALDRAGITSELFENEFVRNIIELIEQIKITWDYILN